MKRIIALTFASLVLFLCGFAVTQPFAVLSPLFTLRPAHAAGALLTTDQVLQLIDRYYAGVRSLDPEQFAGNFAEDGTLEDPVGTPPAEGRQAVKDRYQPATVIFSKINMYPRDVCAPNLTNEAAVRWRATVKFRDTGLVSDRFFGITYFTFNNDGLIQSARVFWYPTDITISGQ